MKDALGHGSDAGAHSTGIQQATAPMQRRQYEAIASAINSYGAAHPDVHGALAQHFADSLRGTNPHYNAGKFQTAAMTGNMGKTKNADPGMQRRHYEAIAGTISSFGHSHPEARADLATHFAHSLGGRNANFDAGRFVKAASK